MDGSIPFWMYIIGFPLLLGPLVTLHELGHYLVGRLFGVKAEAFSRTSDPHKNQYNSYIVRIFA